MGLGLVFDIGIGIIIALAAIVGLITGFTKQFFRVLVGILAVLGSIILVRLLFPIIFNTGIFDKFVSTATGWFKAEFYLRRITDVDSLKSAISDNYLRILSGSADKVFGWMESTLEGAEVMTIGSFFGKAFVNIVIGLSMWTIFYLVIKYFLYGVKYLLGKVTEVVVFKSIDRILGLVWSLVWTYIIVVGVCLTAGELIIVRFFPDAEQAVANVMSQSTLLSFAHNTNVLGSFLAQLLSMPMINLG